MSNDIVARLRAIAAEYPSLNRIMDNEFANAADEIERLRAERDQARRRVCEIAIRNGDVYRRVGSGLVRCETSKEVAEMLGWDCFQENTDAQ